MKTGGALVWDFTQSWSIEEIDLGEPSPTRTARDRDTRTCHGISPRSVLLAQLRFWLQIHRGTRRGNGTGTENG
jgi:hypothetical protein